MAIWDSNFGLPIPPVQAAYAATACFWTSLAYLSFGIPVLIYGLLHIRERKGWIILLTLLGGTLCAVVEPFADLLGGCWHHEVGQPTVFRVLGRGIAPWTIIGYFSYFGALTSLGYLWFTRGVRRQTIWIAFSIAVVADIVMENLFLHLGMYSYYGNQPLWHFGYLPLWWPPVNSMGVLTGIAALIIFDRHIRGLRFVLVPVIFPIADLVSYSLVSYPAVLAVNQQNLPRWCSDLAGLAVWALSALVVYVISNLLAKDSPFRRGDTLVIPMTPLQAGDIVGSAGRRDQGIPLSGVRQ